MNHDTTTAPHEPTREEIEHLHGPVVLEFGAEWCGFCQALAPQLTGILDEYPKVRHVKIEDGPGKPLGRSFRVKLWPTLVFLRDGKVYGQVSRPQGRQIRAGLQAIDPDPEDLEGGGQSPSA